MSNAGNTSMMMHYSPSLYLKLILTVLSFLDLAGYSHAQAHSEAIRIFEDKLCSRNYNTDVRPVRNLSDIVYVNVTFNLVAIKEVNDVHQSFVCNGFFILTWIDELIAWNASDYGGVSIIHPQSEKIWLPKLALSNTLGNRHIFKDDELHPLVFNSGLILWSPGSVFETSCDLDMTKYPYDEQTCIIKLLSGGWLSQEVNFLSVSDEILQTAYQPHDAWDLTSSRVVTYNTQGQNGGLSLSSIEVTFHLKRRPGFFLLNVILPVVLLSLMNILVFLIPAESGEKIGYGITVLLALSVYLSFVSGLLPRSSDKLPIVNVYIFTLLIISALTVVDSIVIVYLHHLQEKEAQHLRTKGNYRHWMTKVSDARNIVNAMGSKVSGTLGPNMGDAGRPVSAASSRQSRQSWGDKQEADGGDKPAINKYKMISKHIDTVSLLLFTVVWLAVTMGSMLYIST